jgi:hypothetical protein
MCVLVCMYVCMYMLYIYIYTYTFNLLGECLISLADCALNLLCLVLHIVINSSQLAAITGSKEY